VTAQLDAPAQQLRALLRGHIVTQLVAAAVRFGIPDHLAGEPLDAAALAERTGIAAAELPRFLRALVALGIVEPVAAGYRGTALAALLRAEWHGTALMAGDAYYAAWAHLDHALVTGRAAFDRAHGRGLWELLAERPEVARSFGRTMRANTEHVADELVALELVPAAGCVADLGAGDGTLLAGLLRRAPGLRGLALERPALLPALRATLTEHGIAERCEVIAGDLRERVPPGAALYVLKSVIHNHGDADALVMLRACKAALTGGARLLIVERALEPQSSLGGAILDLTMLVLFGARDRTPDEYAELATAAGLTVTRRLTTRSGLSILEAMR